MRLLLSSLAERLRTSLFFVPMIGVLSAVAVGFAGPQFDNRVSAPSAVTSTVDSARALLTTVAGATIAFAGIAFSVSLLIIQQAASQYSPRVVRTLFRDPFNRRVMALVVGTFTYCVVVLRSVQSLDPDEPVVPHLSVSLAIVLGIVTILAVIAFIDHSAKAMDVSEILARVRGDAVEQIRVAWPESDDEEDMPEPPADWTPAVVRFAHSGWIQAIDEQKMLAAIPEHSFLRLDTVAGRYAIAGTPICSLWPDDLDEELSDTLRSAVAIGSARTIQQDASYGIRQLADVALKALSPGINDPTTAQDAIFHLTSVMTEVLRRNPPPTTRRRDDGTTMIIPERPDHESLVALAFDEIRIVAAEQPTVCIYLLEALSLLGEHLTAAGCDDRVPLLRQQAGYIRDGVSTTLLASDRARVTKAYDDRFGALA